MTAESVAPSVPLRTHLRTFARWWAASHRRAARSLRVAGRRRDGVRFAALCAGVDLAITSVAAFVVVMLVSPFLGI
jgi:Flp pilus assembly protein TadB